MTATDRALELVRAAAQAASDKGGIAPLDSMLFVTKAPGASTGDLRDGVEKITEDLPTVTLKDPQDRKSVV